MLGYRVVCWWLPDWYCRNSSNHANAPSAVVSCTCMVFQLGRVLRVHLQTSLDSAISLVGGKIKKRRPGQQVSPAATDNGGGGAKIGWIRTFPFYRTRWMISGDKQSIDHRQQQQAREAMAQKRTWDHLWQASQSLWRTPWSWRFFGVESFWSPVSRSDGFHRQNCRCCI